MMATAMTCLEDDPLDLKLTAMLDNLCSRVDDIIAQQDKREEECKLKDELVTRFEQELKLSSSLEAQRAEALRRAARLARACGPAGGAGEGPDATLSEGDHARLEKAKEMYQIAKELTGIRWDFTAPPDVAKGYVRSEARKLLEPFELRCEPSAPATATTTSTSTSTSTAASTAPGAAAAALAGASAPALSPEALSDALWARLIADKENREPR